MAGPRYPREFREETVALIRSGERSVSEVCRELGVAESIVQGWVDRATAAEAQPEASELTAAEREELSRLRREQRVLREEVEILQKARVFFAGERPQRDV
jgi:transposase